MEEEKFKQAQRIMERIHYFETAHNAIHSMADKLLDRQDKDSAEILADTLIDLSKEIYGRWDINVFIGKASLDILKQIEELRKEFKEL